MSGGLFITGTGTDIGKTYISGLIMKKLISSGRSAAYYKAAVSGNDRDGDLRLIPGDALFVRKISGSSQKLDTMCPYIYEAAVSPHLAARFEGDPVSLDRVKEGFDKLCGQYELVTVEGSGGIVCPIRYDDTKIFLTDIIKALGLPCLIAADAGLGTINAVVLTYEYMLSHGIEARGIILNRYRAGDVMHEDNAFMCEKLTGLRIIARVPENAGELDIDINELLKLYY